MGTAMLRFAVGMPVAPHGDPDRSAPGAYLPAAIRALRSVTVRRTANARTCRDDGMGLPENKRRCVHLTTPVVAGVKIVTASDRPKPHDAAVGVRERLPDFIFHDDVPN